MNVAPVGHIGDDVYGKFMDQVLKVGTALAVQHC